MDGKLQQLHNHGNQCCGSSAGGAEISGLKLVNIVAIKNVNHDQVIRLRVQQIVKYLLKIFQ